MSTPNNDMETYLKENYTSYTISDIAKVLAFIPGIDDELTWYWIVELKDGKFALTEAWSYYIGWERQLKAQSTICDTAYACAIKAPEIQQEYCIRREIRKTLIDQLNGIEPLNYDQIEDWG